MTAGELVAALQMAREVGDAQQLAPVKAKADGEPAAETAAVADENVRSLSARLTK
jgi:hypothetical protein